MGRSGPAEWSLLTMAILGKGIGMPLREQGYGVGTPRLQISGRCFSVGRFLSQREVTIKMSEKPVEEDQRLRGEGELTAELISAAQAAQGQLSLQEIDQILGVGPAAGTA